MIKVTKTESESVGYLTNSLGHEWVFTTKKINQYSQPLYTTPQKKEWEGLTDEDRKAIFDLCDREDRGYVAAMVEAKLKEKNGG
jgi:hypothetical protein